MLIDELKNIARNNGIVGAGGAGFPATGSEHGRSIPRRL